MTALGAWWDRQQWTAWGYRLGWELESCNRDGAEFRIKADNEQGYEYIWIPNRARLDINAVIEEAAP